MQLLLIIIYRILEAYLYVLIAYILLSWIPEIRRTRFYEFLERLTNPFMRIFRGIIVIGMIELTPIVGFLFYQWGLSALAFMINSL